MKSSIALIALLLQCCDSIKYGEIELETLLELMEACKPMLRIRLMCGDLIGKRVLNDYALERTIGVSQHLQAEENLVYCTNNSQSNSPRHFVQMLSSGNRNAIGLTWIVIAPKTDIDLITDMAKMDINRRIYFWDLDSNSLVEKYSINGIVVERTLAKLAKNASQVLLLSGDNFLRRRADFQDLTLKTMGHGVDAPFVQFPNEAVHKSVWKKKRRGNVMAELSRSQGSGSFVDTVEMLEADLNFSTRVFLRKDNFRGFPLIKNGSFVGYTGMIGNLLFGEVDLIMTPIQHIIERYGFMAFTHGLGTLTGGLMVGSNAGNEDRAWLTYLLPFDTQLWLLLLVNSAVAAWAIKLVQLMYIHGYADTLIRLVECWSDFWMVLFSYFGRPSSSNIWWTINSTKVLLFIIFLSGNMVFMSYKAGLTAELSVRKQILPFTDPKGMYEADYKYDIIVICNACNLKLVI